MPLSIILGIVGLLGSLYLSKIYFNCNELELDENINRTIETPPPKYEEINNLSS